MRAGRGNQLLGPRVEVPQRDRPFEVVDELVERLGLVPLSCNEFLTRCDDHGNLGCAGCTTDRFDFVLTKTREHFVGGTRGAAIAVIGRGCFVGIHRAWSAASWRGAFFCRLVVPRRQVCATVAFAAGLALSAPYSTQITTACSCGFIYSPTTSQSLSMNCGSSDSLNVSVNHSGATSVRCRGRTDRQTPEAIDVVLDRAE